MKYRTTLLAMVVVAMTLTALGIASQNAQAESVKATGYPKMVSPGQQVDIRWTVSDSGKVKYNSVQWGASESSMLSCTTSTLRNPYSTSFSAPSRGDIYFRVQTRTSRGYFRSEIYKISVGSSGSSGRNPVASNRSRATRSRSSAVSSRNRATSSRSSAASNRNSTKPVSTKGIRNSSTQTGNHTISNYTIPKKKTSLLEKVKQSHHAAWNNVLEHGNTIIRTSDVADKYVGPAGIVVGTIAYQLPGIYQVNPLLQDIGGHFGSWVGGRAPGAFTGLPQVAWHYARGLLGALFE